MLWQRFIISGCLKEKSKASDKKKEPNKIQQSQFSSDRISIKSLGKSLVMKMLQLPLGSSLQVNIKR